MNSMIEAVNAMDDYIARQLGFPCKQNKLLVFTDGIGGIFVQVKDMKKPEFHSIDGPLHDLIDAFNYILFGKVRRI